MSKFQVRISAESAFYIRELRKIYEQESDTHITKAIIIAKAFDSTQNVTNWKKVVQDNSIPLNNIYPVEEKELKINVDISDRVASGIKQYKNILPSATNTRSVTLGVCLKYILKAALLSYQTQNDELISEDAFEKQFIELQKNLSEIVAPVNYDTLTNLLWDFKNRLVR
ncbi:hypothetical protein [Streptococcus suis]